MRHTTRFNAFLQTLVFFKKTCPKRRVYSPAPALQLYSPTQLSNSIQSSTQTSHPAYNFLVYSPFQDYTHFRKILFLPTSTFSPFHLTSIFYLLSSVPRGLYTWCTVNLFREKEVCRNKRRFVDKPPLRIRALMFV